MEKTEKQNVLDGLIKTLKQAGQAVMEYYRSQDYDIRDKGPGNPVTSADLASNKILLNSLGKYGYGILSEESADDKSRLGKDLVWIIDPLDGTADFIRKTTEFTIMAGLVKKDADNKYRPLLGAIYRPATDDIYYAASGQGAYAEHAAEAARRLKVSAETELKKMTMLSSRSHSTGLEKIVAKRSGITNIVSLGSSLKICLLADQEGELSFNPSDKTWEWDICASDLIIHEAGGRLTDIEGNTIYYNKKDPRNKKGYLATNGLIHDSVVKKISELR